MYVSVCLKHREVRQYISKTATCVPGSASHSVMTIGDYRQLDIIKQVEG